MTPREIHQRLGAIEQLAKEADYEEAHIREDLLHADVLRAIATRECDDPSLCAALALISRSIHFPRHCI